MKFEVSALKDLAKYSIDPEEGGLDSQENLAFVVRLLKNLAEAAQRYNIDKDLLESMVFDPFLKDWGFILQVTALIELALNAALENCFKAVQGEEREVLFRYLNIGDLIRKEEVVYANKIIIESKRPTELIKNIAMVRNFYAHNFLAYRLTLPEVLDKLQALSDKKGSHEKIWKRFLKSFRINEDIEKLRKQNLKFRALILNEVISQINFWHLLS